MYMLTKTQFEVSKVVQVQVGVVSNSNLTCDPLQIKTITCEYNELCSILIWTAAHRSRNGLKLHSVVHL
jgi:hypothetical protein